MNAGDIILCISLLLYAFFSGMEAAFVSTGKFRLPVDDKQNGFVNVVINIFCKNPTQFIYTLLVGNITSLTVYGILIVQKTAVWGSLLFDNGDFIVLFQLIVTFFILFVVAEFIPKLIFRINLDLFGKIFALPMLPFYYLFYPIVLIFVRLAHLFFAVFKIDVKRGAGQNNFGKGYLDYFILQSIEELSEDANVETEVKLFQNALDFSTVKLRNCIVPRTEIVAVDVTETVEKLKELFIETGLSKIIVYKEDIDEVVGYIHSSEMFRRSENWTRSIKQIPIVPDTMAAHKLMNILMQEKKSIAVVVDEFGGTAGIVTLEDLVEEIFGDIEDEHDSQSFLAKAIGKNEYIFSGRNEVGKLNELFDLDLPESDEYITLAGLILEHYQKFPKLNEEIQIGKYLFRVVRMTSTKIDLVRMIAAERGDEAR